MRRCSNGKARVIRASTHCNRQRRQQREASKFVLRIKRKQTLNNRQRDCRSLKNSQSLNYFGLTVHRQYSKSKQTCFMMFEREKIFDCEHRSTYDNFYYQSHQFNSFFHPRAMQTGGTFSVGIAAGACSTLLLPRSMVLSTPNLSDASLSTLLCVVAVDELSSRLMFSRCASTAVLIVC